MRPAVLHVGHLPAVQLATGSACAYTRGLRGLSPWTLACRPLYCPDGSFLERFTHNYQHASSYLGFTLSGTAV